MKKKQLLALPMSVRDTHFLFLKPVLFLLFLFCSFLSFAQQRITGRVASKDSAISNVTVAVKGQTIATQTNADGNFTITVPAGGTLVFSSIGFLAQEVKVGSRNVINVQLETSVAQSSTEVVVVGYGSQRRSDITGAVVSVPKNRLSQLPVTNVLQAVQGSVPGVNITQTSSVPGSAPGVQIRGQNSISAGNGPYVVVDGIQISQSGGSLNDINPNDIASIEILKDASAVAIYGKNGSNGVILITTKRGANGKAQIRYNGYVGTENIAHILKPMDGPAYVQKYADYIKQVGQTQTNPVPNLAELANYQAGKTTDWVKEATQQGIISDNTLSISGGNKDVRYYVAGEYLKQKGVVKGYQYHRMSLRSNLDINVTSFLTAGTSLYVANNNYDGGRANLLLATAISPYGQEYTANGTYNIYPMAPELLYENPLLGLYTDRINRNTNLTGNGYAEVKFGGIFSGLKYRLNAGYTYIPARNGLYTGRASNSITGGSAQSNFLETGTLTVENILTYTKDLGKDHRIDFTGLYSNLRRKYFTTNAGATGFVNDQLTFNNLGAGATQTSGSFSDVYSNISQMARLNYGFKSRYLLTLTARRDGSSVFGANNSKYGVFPAAALAWNVSSESFMQNVRFVRNLKLRASYGKTGNEALNPYVTITTDNAVRYPFNGVSTIGLLAGNLGNANLKWESTTGLNLGVDYDLFNSRITGSIDLYSTRSNDLLLRRSLPIVTGYASVIDNIGEVKNKGIDVLVNTRNIVSKNFGWESIITFSANQNRIADLYGDGKSDVGNRWFIGSPISVIYDYQMVGIWQTGEDASKQDPGAKPGDIKFRDVNNDGKITADGDRVILGHLQPKWTGGLSNTFHYRNFNLTVFIQTAQGITKNNPDLTYADEAGRRNTPAEIGYWTSDNRNNTRPALSYFNTRGYGYASNASYTRIKDVTISYVLAPKTLEKIGLSSLTFYASGRNLATFTNWIGWDPENNYSTRGSGDWTNNYPTIRSFTLGFNAALR